eukprot:4065226-Prymnesium_polylepis.1
MRRAPVPRAQRTDAARARSNAVLAASWLPAFVAGGVEGNPRRHRGHVACARNLPRLCGRSSCRCARAPPKPSPLSRSPLTPMVAAAPAYSFLPPAPAPPPFDPRGLGRANIAPRGGDHVALI